MLYSENIHIDNKGITFTTKDGRRISSSVAIDKALIRLLSWWQDFTLLLVNSAGHCPFWFWRRFFYTTAGVVIGSKSKIHLGCRFFTPSGVTIGDDSIVGEFAFLDGRGPLKIGNHVDMASQVLIYNSDHDLTSPEFTATVAPVKIEDYVFIGPRSIILPGVTIGKGAVVAAGAVVTKTIPAGKIYAGVPAKEIGSRPLADYHYRLGRSRLFQ